jgi:hypothetical protein
MKYNTSLFESIKDSLNKKQQNTDSGFKDFLKLEKDNTYIVRLLPNVENFEKTFLHYYSHVWKSNKDGSIVNVFCPNSYSERCPVDEYRSKVWKTGSEEEKESIKPLKRNENWLVNVYVVKDPTNPENQGKIKILRYGKQLDKIIMNAIQGDESEEFGPRIFDLSDNGCNLKIKVESNEGGYATYVASRFQSPSEISDLENPDSIYESIKNLEDIFKHQSYEDIENTLNIHWFNKEPKTQKQQNTSTVEEDSDDDVPFVTKDSDKKTSTEKAEVDLDDLLKSL